MGYKSVHDDDNHIEGINEFFDGYASMYDLWILNKKKSTLPIDHNNYDPTDPICAKCYKQWECILYYFENSKQVANYLNLRYFGTPPFDLNGKNQITS